MTSSSALTINQLLAPSSAELTDEQLCSVYGGEDVPTGDGYIAFGMGAIGLGAAIGGSSTVGSVAVAVAATLGITATAPAIAAGVVAFGAAALITGGLIKAGNAVREFRGSSRLAGRGNGPVLPCLDSLPALPGGLATFAGRRASDETTAGRTYSVVRERNLLADCARPLHSN